MPRLILILLIWFLCCGFGYGTQKPPLGTQLNRSHPLAQGLVGAWIMNEGSGTVVNDLAGKHKLITTGNAVLRQSLYFDGVSGKAGSAYILCPSLPVTVHLIINCTSLTNRARLLHSSWNVATNNLYGVTLDVTVTGKLAFSYYRGTVAADANAGRKTITGNTTLLTGIKYSVTGISSGLDDLRLAINGATETGTIDGTGATFNPGTVPGGFGALAYAMAWYYGNFHMEAGYIYSRALSSSEISNLNREPYAMFKTGLAQRPYMNFGTGGAPAPAPSRRKGQAIILGKAGKNDIIAWAKEGE